MPISESQRPPRITFAEQVKRKLESDHGGGPVASKNEKDVRALSPTRDRPERIEWDASDIAGKDGTVDRRDWERHQAAARNAAHGRKVAESIGLDPDQVSEKHLQKAGEMLSEMGRKPSEQGAKTKLGLMAQDAKTGDFKHLPPVRDYKSISQIMRDGEERALSLQEATELQTNFREFQRGFEEARQRDLLAEVQGQLKLGATHDELADPNFQPLTQPRQPVQSAQQTEPQRPAAQPQQPDPLARERQLLQRQHAEAERIAEVQRWSAAESAEAQKYHNLNGWLAQQPEMANPAALTQLQTRVSFGDAAAAQRLQELQRATIARDQAKARFAELNRGATDRRIALQNERTARDRQDYARWAARNDAQYQKALSEVLPQYATDQGQRELGAQARKTLASVGLDEQKVSRYWSELLRNEKYQNKPQPNDNETDNSNG